MGLRGRAFLAPLAAALIVACNSSTPTVAPGASTSGTQPGGSSAVIGLPTAGTGQSETSSEDLIAAALAAGSITYEDSLVDRALALFNSPGLPDAFYSAQSNLDAGTELFAEIEAADPPLGSEAMGKLAPFLARPTDPTSLFSKPATASAGGVVLAADTTIGWKSLPAADGAARVWVPDSVAADNHLRQHAADVSRVWAAYEDVFTYPDSDAAGVPNTTVNPDAAVDFYFIEASEFDPRRPDCTDPSVEGCSLAATAAAGFARTADARRGNASSAYFVLDAGQGGDKALFELAHEIAHGGQFHYDGQESAWLSESSANWVAYRVFQKLGIPPEPAYGWLPPLFAKPGTSLTSESDKWAYRAWLYFQFAAMQRGDGIVAAIWADAGKAGSQGAQAVDDVFPFADHFADYAVRNWNRDPVPNRYRSAPDATFPDLTPAIRHDTPALKAGDEVQLDVALPSLASAYFTFGFDESTRKVIVDNRLAGLDGAHVWAIREIAGIWHEPEDWSAEDTMEFCRDNETENLSKLVIIVSYAKVAGRLDTGGANPKVTGSAGGCGGWKGTMTATSTWHFDDQSGHGSATFNGMWSVDPGTNVACQFDEVPCVPYLPTGTISWDWHQASPSCQEDEHGSVAAGHYRDVITQRMVIGPADPGKLKYWVSGGFDIPTKLRCANFEASSGVSFYANVPETTHSGTGAYGNTCDYTTWEIDVTATTISGSCYLWDTPDHTMKFDWNLTRIGP